MKEKNKNNPIQDRVPRGQIPFYDGAGVNREEKFRLATIDEVLDLPTSTLQDSIWARPQDIKSLATQPRKCSLFNKKENSISPNIHVEATYPPESSRVPPMSPGAHLQSSNGDYQTHQNTQNSQSRYAQHFKPPLSNATALVPPHLRKANQKSGSNLLTHLEGSAPSLNKMTDSYQSLSSHAQVKPPKMGSLQILGHSRGGINDWSNTPHIGNQQSLQLDGPNYAPQGQTMAATAWQDINRSLKHGQEAPPIHMPNNRNSVRQEPTLSHVQKISGPDPVKEDAFLKFMIQKAVTDAEAKKKAILAAAQPVVAPVPQPESFVTPARSNFIPNYGSDTNFQDYLKVRMAEQVTNGKKYIFTGSYASLQKAQNAPQANRDLEENAHPCRKVDPHAFLSTGDMSLKVTANTVETVKSEHCRPSTAVLRVGWDGNPVPTDAKTINQSIPDDHKAQEKIDISALPLTEAAIVTITGFAPRRRSDSFADRVSDAGISADAKENVRATQGKDPKEELLDWDGKTWLPPPVEWEVDRGDFDNGFMPRYIREDWVPHVPRGPSVMVDITAPEFKFGSAPVTNRQLDEPIVQPETIPDVDNSENEQRRLFQTAHIDSLNATKRLEKRIKSCQRWIQAHEAHNLAIASKEPEPNPYAPTIDVYLRPAAETDLKGIAEVYNQYVQGPNSILTEDQAPITHEDVSFLLKHSKQEKLPMIVAVRGHLPSPPLSKFQNGRPELGKVALPQFEGIIGVAFAESYNYGIGGLRTGRSRTTLNLQFYVHPDHTRKGVGRSLLDRLIQCLSYSYGARNGYDWVNPGSDPVYKVGGTQYWHQLVIQLAVLPEHDPYYEFMTKFLRRYFFDEEARLQRVIRSSTSPGGAKFADMVIFVKEATQALEFAPFI